MAFNLTNFKEAFQFEGARPTLFEANVFGGGVGPDFRFHCKSAQLPGKTFGTIEVPYFGRKIKVKGDQTFTEWTVTVLNETTFNVRNSFERWMAGMNSHETNIQSNAAYKNTTANVIQFDSFDNIIKRYDFVGIWPSDISPIDIAWDSNDTIEEFTVTLQYDWWESASILPA